MPIPKSLHTIRVLTVMTELVKASHPDCYTNLDAMALVVVSLGYDERDDDYGLIAKALAQLDKPA